MLTDTHSHLYDEAFDSDRHEAILRATQAGIGLILLPAIDSESYTQQETLAASNPTLFRQMMGLHPTSVDQNYIQSLAKAKELLYGNPQKYIAIGETGLDFYWDTSYLQQQIDALEQQMAWADELDKPIVLHLRSPKDNNSGLDAYGEVFRLMQRRGIPKRKGIMHCFSGTPDDASKAVALGFMLGIGGTVTYKKSTLPDIVRATPLDSIVLETDDPYLPPVPHRGQRNEPAFMTHVAEKIADIKGLTPAQVADATTANARRLFRI